MAAPLSSLRVQKDFAIAGDARRNKSLFVTRLQTEKTLCRNTGSGSFRGHVQKSQMPPVVASSVPRVALHDRSVWTGRHTGCVRRRFVQGPEGGAGRAIVAGHVGVSRRRASLAPHPRHEPRHSGVARPACVCARTGPGNCGQHSSVPARQRRLASRGRETAR